MRWAHFLKERPKKAKRRTRLCEKEYAAHQRSACSLHDGLHPARGRICAGSGASDAVAAVSEQEAETPAEGIKINAAYFPDPSFQKYVTKQFDTDQDGTLSQEEREAVTEIKISGKGCTSYRN